MKPGATQIDRDPGPVPVPASTIAMVSTEPLIRLSTFESTRPPDSYGGLAAMVWLALGAVLLAGCGMLQELIPTEPAPTERDTTRQAHARALSHFQTWTMLGTLVVRSGGDASRVTMRWRQARNSYLMRFTALLGAGLFELKGSEAGVEAKFADGRRARAGSPETLLEREIGWSVPLEGLRYWIVGAPAPDGATAKMEFDGHGRLARLEQAGWTVIYEKYRSLDDLSLPERIRFSNESIDATLVVRRWKAGHDQG